eukprot:6948271-Alexandrium_andersonii.AAC.1
MQNCFGRSELELRGPRNNLKFGPRKLPMGAFSATARADSESADESGDRGGPKTRTMRSLWALASESPVG